MPTVSDGDGACEAALVRTVAARRPFRAGGRLAAVGLQLALALVALGSCGEAGSPAREPSTDDGTAAAGSGAAEPPLGAPQAPATNPGRNAYFGDLHVHTNWSLDAFIMGANLDDPAVAYRYGRGDPVARPDGTELRLRVPLDFMAVTDHDSTLGEMHVCGDADEPGYDTPACRRIRNMQETLRGRGIGERVQEFFRHYRPHHARGRRPAEICGEDGSGPQNRCYERVRHLWHEIQAHADAFYEPGRFTTFPGWEWSASPPGYGMLHRNVIFEGHEVPEWGGSSVEMQLRPDRLWEWLETACTGECRVVAIPHNPNLSGGIAFAEPGWAPFTPELLRRRAWAEPLVEIHQIKGNSECYLGLGTTDEECDFEPHSPICTPEQRTGPDRGRCTHASDYVRNALKAGLRLEAEYGVNPFKFGFIASTDDHQSLPGSTDEDDFTDRTLNMGTSGLNGGANLNPGGLVGVWAEENTRGSIFDALRRRETFGTSGTRIRVRFFAGWDYPADLHRSRTLIDDAYRTGVTMGADLPLAPAGDAEPRFVVWATKDAAGANLQKIQIVKGWADADGQTFEWVHDVVCGDGLEPDPGTRRCPDNGAQVSLADCSYSADLGAGELGTTWRDPDFDRSQRAFYYARVLENPTCRWSTHRALARQTVIPDPPLVKERAWSSPIWYTPQ